ncbi:MAG: YfiR family protein [Pirellulales bacterium]
MHVTHNTNGRWRLPSTLRWWPSAARQIGRTFVLWTVIAAAMTPVAAQSPTAPVINREYAIKAAFLYHFLNYVEWPAEAFAEETSPFVIGVHGTNPFGNALNQIAKDKKVRNRSIEVRSLSSAGQVGKCHILFVPKSVPVPVQAAVLKSARDSHILTVGESDDFIDRGGAAQFFLEGNKVRFAFNTDAINSKNLKASAKLLALATIASDK